jgi:hypothetical protein
MPAERVDRFGADIRPTAPAAALRSSEPQLRLALVTGFERSCGGHCPEESIAGEVFVWIAVGRISTVTPPVDAFSPYETPACRNSTP